MLQSLKVKTKMANHLNQLITNLLSQGLLLNLMVLRIYSWTISIQLLRNSLKLSNTVIEALNGTIKMALEIKIIKTIPKKEQTFQKMDISRSQNRSMS